MNAPSQILIAFLILASCVCASLHAAPLHEPDETRALAGMLQLPNDLRATPSRAYSDNHPDAHCIELRRRRSSTFAGVICTSTSERFLNEMGIEAARQAPRRDDQDGASTTPGWTLSTPMSLYELRPVQGVSNTAVTADVDCDIDGHAIYRATGDCRVTVVEQASSSYVYCLLVLKDLRRKKAVLSAASAAAIEQQLMHLPAARSGDVQ